jgi:hypothetical protein
LSDAIPQQNAGLRSEPPISLPRPIGLMPVAIAAASPPLEPPAVRPRCHGLRQAVQRAVGMHRRPMSGMLVRASVSGCFIR